MTSSVRKAFGASVKFSHPAPAVDSVIDRRSSGGINLRAKNLRAASAKPGVIDPGDSDSGLTAQRVLGFCLLGVVLWVSILLPAWLLLQQIWPA